MAAADYAKCEICGGKAVYDGDEVIREQDTVLIVHKRCGRVRPLLGIEEGDENA